MSDFSDQTLGPPCINHAFENLHGHGQYLLRNIMNFVLKELLCVQRSAFFFFFHHSFFFPPFIIGRSTAPFSNLGHQAFVDVRNFYLKTPSRVNFCPTWLVLFPELGIGPLIEIYELVGAQQPSWQHFPVDSVLGQYIYWVLLFRTLHIEILFMERIFDYSSGWFDKINYTRL